MFFFPFETTVRVWPVEACGVGGEIAVSRSRLRPSIGRVVGALACVRVESNDLGLEFNR